MLAAMYKVLLYLFRCFTGLFRGRSTAVSDTKPKRVLITGTDSGIGRHLALDLVRRHGMIVYAGCHTEDGARTLRASSSDDMRVFMLDVSREDSVLRARDFVTGDLPDGQGLWALVNNAGVVGGVMFDWTTTQQYHDVMNVNFYGQVRMTKAFLPLVQREGGRIVNVASIMGRVSLNGSPYVCSKFAVEAYSDGLRRHVAPHGVKVSIIEPGAFKTNLSSPSSIMSELDKQWNGLPEDRKRELGGESYKQKVEDGLSGYFDNYPLASGNRIEEVTDSIRHAITSGRPKDRYVCGFDARFLYRPCATVLPDWMVDRLLNFLYSR